MNEPEIIERLTATKPYTDFPKTLDDAIAEIRGLRAALAPFAAVDVDGMISLDEANLDKEDFHRARIAFTGEQTVERKGK